MTLKTTLQMVSPKQQLYPPHRQATATEAYSPEQEATATGNRPYRYRLWNQTASAVICTSQMMPCGLPRDIHKASE